MSETPPNPASPDAAADQPMMRVLSQYLKDLSFENPGSPTSLRADLAAPSLEVSVDVNAKRLGEGQFEVELACRGTATRESETVFVVECNYAGLFLLQNIPEGQIEAVLLVEAPRLLFPFARQIVAGATRDGGFPPLTLEPLDFASMYRAQAERRAAAGSDTVGTA
ncbi:export protein SecB [Parvularcula bermudensis HTCC2503]|uniref:Protein-export protein SecB n=1 Tax=Parvularcula bermudensis (strain ATCC BAA-594 / HTCC2503 / KCTC 12087) TaxID=314260 RepID=E0TF68_PARBH|nr:protein-export chaperone SecB [Parvularcula bermudensis]ADM08986.1 export protein SecB [Parvularcula bermudensis HTCC2503]